MHIDVPLSEDEEQSAKIAEEIIAKVKTLDLKGLAEVVQYKMSRDEDRRSGNYLLKDDNGHISQKKFKIYPHLSK